MQNHLDIQTISKQTGISIRELNRLNQDLWYHGTTIEDAENIAESGVIANYNLGAELDFGPGFYLTDTHEHATSFISRAPIISHNGVLKKHASWAVIEFLFNPYKILFMSGYNYTYRWFPKHNYDFANFVFENRISNRQIETPHNYDLIWGVMSDNNPNQVIHDYKQGSISYEEAIKLLQKPNSMKQLFVGNQAICNMLKINKIYMKEEDQYEQRILS